MTDIYVEHHLFSILCSITASREILDLLPEEDMIDQLKFLAKQTEDILMHIIEEKHYGTNNLDWFMQYTETVKDEIATIKATLEKK